MGETVEQLIDDFDLLDEWEDKYRYIIELGRALPPFKEQWRDAAHKVSGCASQVWINAEHGEGPEGPIVHFSGDSDALIVKGLVAIALMIFSDKRPEEISAVDPDAIFARLGLKEHLTQQRANGLASMIARIKQEAQH